MRLVGRFVARVLQWFAMRDVVFPEGQPMLRMRGVSKSFGFTPAVRDVSFDLMPGQVLALVGSNGAGKTTTLRMLATLLPPDTGEIAIMGHSVADPFKVRPLLGFMPDVLGIYPEMLVGEYLEFFARAYNIPENMIDYCINEAVSFTGLQQMLPAPAAGLSRGILQRVALARALLHDPPVLLMDEPAAGLDPRSRADFRYMLLELRRKGKTVIISSHVLADLEDTCSHIAVIDHGVLMAFETMGTFLERAQRTRTWKVRVNGASDPTFKMLQSLPNVANLRYHGETMLFETPFGTKGAEILRNLVSADAEIEEFAEVPLSLEEAYLARTGGPPA